MKLKNKIRDIITLAILAGLLLGCYTTSHRGPRVLDPGEVSASASYLRFNNTESDPGDSPGELVGIEGRVGLIKGIDIGLARTFDISDGVESGEGIDTYWFDSKFQLMNRDNILNKPTLSLGYGYGKVINEDDFWVNTLYLSYGVQTNKASFFYSFRYETFDDKINLIPTWVFEDSFDEVQKAHIIGLEVEFTPQIKPVFEIGRFYVDDFGDGLNVVTAGVNFYKK
ncbi:MAG: hypothetical protein HQ510_05340 [Candidatus Marinimicrobia bacterium]|nr:hypothetical protein [Candidatus Neomarinimicrobiota bacterium]